MSDLPPVAYYWIALVLMGVPILAYLWITARGDDR